MLLLSPHHALILTRSASPNRSTTSLIPSTSLLHLDHLLPHHHSQKQRIIKTGEMKPEVCVCVCVCERERERESLSLIQDLQHMMMTTKRKLILCLTTEVIKASSHMCMSSSPNLGQTYSQIKRKTGGHQPRKFWNYFPPPPHHHHHHHHHSCEGMMSQEKRPGTSNWRHMTTESKATHNHSVSRSQKHPPTTHHSFLLVTD